MKARISETEAVEYVRRLAEAENTPGSEKATITMGPFSAFTLIGALQLAMRHPDFSPSQARLLSQLIDQFRPLFRGTPGEQLLNLGDDPANDVQADCRYPSGPHSPKCPPEGHRAFVADGR